MGSGCTDCNNNNWPVDYTPDDRVKYTGPAIPELGICTGDLLSEVESVILNRILDVTTAEDITLSSLTLDQCDYIKQFIQLSNQDKSLIAVIDVIIKAICQLNADITSSNEDIGSITNHVYDLKCLTVTDPGVQNVIQALIDDACVQRDAINELFTDVNNPTLGPTVINQITEIVTQKVLDTITSCGSSGGYTYGMNKVYDGSSSSLTIEALVPPYCPIPCFADKANFTSTGIGLGGFCGWYICNGLNGTPDMRGYAFAGATDVQGGILDSRVDPTILGNSDYATTNYQKKGYVAVKLDLNQIPAHKHFINPDSHQHFFNFYNFGFKPGSGQNAMCKYPGGGAGPDSMQTSVSTTGNYFTENTGGNNSGGVDSHENRQPTIYGIWIMRKN